MFQGNVEPETQTEIEGCCYNPSTLWILGDIYRRDMCIALKRKLIRRILFLRIETRAEVCSSSTSYSSLSTCVSRYWMRRVRSSQENTRFCSAAESCWTEKISRTNPCRGCRMKLGTTSRNSTSYPDFTGSFLLLSNSREIGTIGAYHVIPHIVILML